MVMLGTEALPTCFCLRGRANQKKKKDSLLYADEMGECTKAENKLKKDYCDVQFMQSFSSKVQEYKIL